MTDDARRVLSRAEAPRIFAAQSKGGMCAHCGRALTATEPVWVARLDVVVGGRRAGSYRTPVGRECVPPEFARETEGTEPRACFGRGRGVYYQATDRRHRLALCSKRCAGRYQTAREREARGS